MAKQERAMPPIHAVLKQLERYINPEKMRIKQRVETISSLVHSVTEEQLVELLNTSKKRSSQEKERFENISVAYLLQLLEKEAKKASKLLK